MKVLFTKKINPKDISKTLGTDLDYDVVEVIKTKSIDLKSFDLNNQSIIFSSTAGVKSFLENGFKAHQNINVEVFNKIYVVGKKTKKECLKNGLNVFKTKKNAKKLAEFITEKYSEESFLHFCGNLSLDIFNTQNALNPNPKYKKIICYTTTLLYPKVTTSYDAVVFFSPSGVKSFVEHNSLEDTVLFTIGKTTESELKNHTQKNIQTSTKNNLEDVLKLIEIHFLNPNKNP